MSNSSSLAILLDAPLQAWGVSSRFQQRETEAFPVKSALLGLLAAAMRINKNASNEIERLAPLAALRVAAYRLPKFARGGLREKVLDVQRLVDFHTIGGGYDKDASAAQKLSIPRKASGPPFGTVITRRAYLTDARFAAVFIGDADTIRAAAGALADPAWGVWFGRKACLPALPLSPMIAATPVEALTALLARLAEWEGCAALNPATLESWAEPETPDLAEGDFFLHDTPLSFRDRTFAGRAVRHHRATDLKANQFSDSLQVPDAFFESLVEKKLQGSEEADPGDPLT